MRWIVMPDRLDEEQEYRFPPAESATPNGVVCYGGNLSPGALISAYRQGIFPWPSNPAFIQWCSPDPRFIILRGFLHVTESAQKALKKALKPNSEYALTLDNNFQEVIKNCAAMPRAGQPGTWIFSNIVDAYTRLHEIGYAHSVEVWKNGNLVGGLYGVSIGMAFFGESMFSLESNASKIGFLSLAKTLFNQGFEFIDCQVYTPYLELMGGIDVPRLIYLSILDAALKKPTMKGSWSKMFPGFPKRELIMSADNNHEVMVDRQ